MEQITLCSDAKKRADELHQIILDTKPKTRRELYNLASQHIHTWEWIEIRPKFYMGSLQGVVLSIYTPNETRGTMRVQCNPRGETYAVFLI